MLHRSRSRDGGAPADASWTERDGVLGAGGAVRKTVNYTFDLAGNRSSRTELDAGGTHGTPEGFTQATGEAAA